MVGGLQLKARIKMGLRSNDINGKKAGYVMTNQYTPG